MIRRLVAVSGWFLGVLFLPGLLSAACEFRPLLSRQLRTTAVDVEVDGNDVWVATTYGVDLYSRAGSPPALVGSLALPGATTSIAPAGQFLYAASGSTLHVVARGADLHSVFALELGGTVSDLLLTPRFLYAATSTGVVQVDLLIPGRPAVGTQLSTSTGAAFSLALLGSYLYAADGDASIEVYTLQLPDLPQRIASVLTLPFTTAVHASGGNLLATDGQQTQVFSGSGSSLSLLETLPVSVVAFHPVSSQTFFAAGQDRRVRAYDRVSRSVVFDHLLPVSLGNVNRIAAMDGTSTELYVAAGDLGFLTFDLSGFTAPYVSHSYRIGSTHSVFESGTNIFAAMEAGGLRQFARQADGALTQTRQWDDTRVSTILQVAGDLLLSASGSSLTLWNLAGSAPSAVSTGALANSVRSAILKDRIAVVVLADRTVWRADLNAATAVLTQIDVGAARPSSIAAASGGSALALADIEDAGTTTIRYYPSGDLSGTPQIASIEGAATSGIAISDAGVVAAATFRGVTLVDFAAGGSVAILPQTNVATRDLHVSGDDLFVLTSSRLQVWSLTSRQLRQEVELPAEAFSVHRAADEATVATSEGLITVNANTQSLQPEPISNFPANAYHRKAVASGDYVYLFDGRNVDILFARTSGAMVMMRRVSFPGALVDITASPDRFFTLSPVGIVSSLRRDGSLEAEFSFSQLVGMQPLSLNFLSGALYVSLSVGCPSACEKATLIVDPRSMTQSSSLSAELMDAVTDGTTAYAIFDQPDEIRILNLNDPYHPVIIGSRASEGDPVSVSFSASHQTVFTLGQKLYSYSTPSLSKIGEQLDNYSDPTGRLSYFDQTVRVLSGDCALIAGREAEPELRQILSPGVWIPSATPTVPSTVRSIALRDGMLYLLSDHSLEVWSSQPLPPRGRPARR